MADVVFFSRWLVHTFLLCDSIFEAMWVLYVLDFFFYFFWFVTWPLNKM